MASSKIALPSAVLVLRLLTLALLVGSLALILVDKFHVSDAEAILLDVPAKEITFKDVYAYRYVLAIAVAGCVYTLLQTSFAAVSIARKKAMIGGSEGVALLLICADVELGFRQCELPTCEDLAIAVAGCVYTLLQTPFVAVSIARKKAMIGGSEGVALLLICADVVFALVIATGAAAGYGYTGDAKRDADSTYRSWERFAAVTGSLIPPEVTQIHTDISRFFMLAFSSAGLMLLAAACMALIIMISVYALVRR